jgi:hypothetical protein
MNSGKNDQLLQLFHTDNYNKVKVLNDDKDFLISQRQDDIRNILPHLPLAEFSKDTIKE